MTSPKKEQLIMPRGKKSKQDAQRETESLSVSNAECTKPQTACQDARGNVPKSNVKLQNPKNFNDSKANNLSEENILTIVENKMSEVFVEQYEELKEKLITLMAQQVSKLIAKVDNIEQESLKYKEDHQDHSNNTITLVENSAELEAFKNSQSMKSVELSNNIANISNQLSEFSIEIESTKQKLKQNNVRLVGLPESQCLESDEMKTKVMQFSEDHLGLGDLSKDDIEEVTRLGKEREDKPRDVLITFRNKQIRNKFYQQRRNLYDASTKRSSTGVYINEDLTPYRQRLYFDARNLRKRAAIHSVWTSEGTIMVKLEESSLPKPIFNHRDLADLLRKSSDDTPDTNDEQ